MRSRVLPSVVAFAVLGASLGACSPTPAAKPVVDESHRSGGPSVKTGSTAAVEKFDPGALSAVPIEDVAGLFGERTLHSLVSNNGQSLVGQGGGTLVSQGGGALVSQGGGTLVNQGGGTLVSQGGGALVSQSDAATLGDQGGGTLITQGGGTLVSQGGGALVSQGGGLFVPLSPPTLLADTASALVANNSAGFGGSGLVTGYVMAPSALLGNNGSAYRLNAATTKLNHTLKPAIDVRAIDIDGLPILDAKGNPLIAKTNANGQYAFKGTLPRTTLFLAADLGAAGTLLSILPGTPRGRAALRVDLDVIATSLSLYIVTKFMPPGRTNRKTALSKVPLELLVATWVEAVKAIEASAAPLPTTLVSTDLIAALDARRKESPPLDAKLYEIEALLFSSTNDDTPALERDLGGVKTLAAAPDGSVYILSETDGGVLRVLPDGTTEQTLAPGMDAGAIAVDPQGHVLVVTDRVQRLRPDGTLEALSDPIPDARGGGLLLGEGNTIYYLDYAPDSSNARLFRIEAGSATLVKALDFGVGTTVNSAGYTADGKIHLALHHDPAQPSPPGLESGVYVLDPLTGDLILKQAGEYQVDQEGRIYRVNKGKIERLDGHTWVLVGEGEAIEALAGRGTGAFFVNRGQVLRVNGGRTVPVAGRRSKQPRATSAPDQPQNTPSVAPK